MLTISICVYFFQTDELVIREPHDLLRAGCYEYPPDDDDAEIDTCDKETNTECNCGKRHCPKSALASSIRRSQTFSPLGRPGCDYICKVRDILFVAPEESTFLVNLLTLEWICEICTTFRPASMGLDHALVVACGLTQILAERSSRKQPPPCVIKICRSLSKHCTCFKIPPRSK